MSAFRQSSIAPIVAICLLSLISSTRPQQTSSMQNSGIVPDIVDQFGDATIAITYSGDLHVSNGNELTPRQVKDLPHVAWSDIVEPSAFYTLILSDPDAPSRAEPTMREMRHWCVVNIPGDQVSDGETLYEYIGSGAPEKTGLHRYVFMVFRQANGRQQFDEERIPRSSRKNRPQTSTRAFAQKHNLGDPIAVNFFQAQYDDYVPVLRQQFTE